MTMDLWMLLAAVLLTWLLIMLAATPPLLSDPLWAMGSRDRKLEQGVWAARALRTSENMKENLPLFAALVLIAHVSGHATHLAIVGAELFVAARIVHAVIYLAGIPYLRTLIWAVSIAGMGMIVAALF